MIAEFSAMPEAALARQSLMSWERSPVSSASGTQQFPADVGVGMPEEHEAN